LVAVIYWVGSVFAQSDGWAMSSAGF